MNCQEFLLFLTKLKIKANLSACYCLRLANCTKNSYTPDTTNLKRNIKPIKQIKEQKKIFVYDFKKHQEFPKKRLARCFMENTAKIIIVPHKRFLEQLLTSTGLSIENFSF